MVKLKIMNLKLSKILFINPKLREILLNIAVCIASIFIILVLLSSMFIIEDYVIRNGIFSFESIFVITIIVWIIIYGIITNLIIVFKNFYKESKNKRIIIEYLLGFYFSSILSLLFTSGIFIISIPNINIIKTITTIILNYIAIFGFISLIISALIDLID